MSPLRFHPQAPQDVAEAIAYYEEISRALANQLRAAIREAFPKVRSHPLATAVAFDDVHFVRVTRFPYLAHYRIRADATVVLGIFHGASDPERWYRRASEDM